MKLMSLQCTSVQSCYEFILTLQRLKLQLSLKKICRNPEHVEYSSCIFYILEEAGTHPSLNSCCLVSFSLCIAYDRSWVFLHTFPVDTAHTAAVIQADSAVRQWQGFTCLQKCHPSSCRWEMMSADTHTHTHRRTQDDVEVLVVQTFPVASAGPGALVISLV